jgi:hypothetical protein
MILVEDSSSPASSSSSPFQPHWDLYPRIYVAPKRYSILDQLDGDLTKEPWNGLLWSEDFDDIRGADDAGDDDRPNPDCRTRFKAFWDDTHLYIGGLIQSDMATEAHFTERNSPIFQKDSDFEIFVDALGSCHFYKELEVNAINTVWNLMLDKPYRDGGVEHSGRIANPGDVNYYEVYGQKTAAKLLKGSLNDPATPATWSVEVALGFKDIMANITTINDNNKFPRANTMWRINFSRVEKKGDINWTWQPSRVWDPVEKRVRGFVDMHLPDSWGYLYFGGEKDPSKEPSFQHRDGSWPARIAATNIYYAQRRHLEVHGNYAKSVKDLEDLVDSKLLAPFKRIDIEARGEGYTVTIHGNPDGSIVSINNERYIQVTATPIRDQSRIE